MSRFLIFVLGMVAVAAQNAGGADMKKLQAEQALLKSLEIRPGQLMPLKLETALVRDGRAEAVICHADDPPWREAARMIQKAIAETTGVSLPLKTDRELSPDQADAQNTILLGHLDNNRHVARLYHNFFVCLDVGFTGRAGYEIRSVHNPFGAGHNYILVGGSSAEGTLKAAQVFADLLRQKARKGDLVLDRILEVKFDPQDRPDPPPTPITQERMETIVANGRRLMFSPGQARGAVGILVENGVGFHRTGDPLQGQAYRALTLALLEYYQKDEYINTEGMGRYDRDFRDAWTHEVAILWDLHEESGLFSDSERLNMTNLLIRLGLECVIYQGWNRPETLERWAKNQDIVHNHNTFPALGVLFVGNYMKRHYKAAFVDDWLKVAHGIFNGQKHSSKPQEDAASYQWLPIIHTIIYSLSQGDMTFFQEGHVREAAKVALMVMDNAGYQAAFGDHEHLKSASALSPVLQVVGWYHKDPGFLWGARLAAPQRWGLMGQTYASSIVPSAPADQVGVTFSRLPRQAYDYAQRNSQYPTPPNLPYEQTFDKLTFRGGWDRNDEYLLVDGFGRGNHMHFDANAIISFAKGGEPLLVDGEYIKNAPKYHNSLVIIRDGVAEYTPAVTGLAYAEKTETGGRSRTWLTQYNGAEWTRTILWRRNDYFLVCDEVRALQAGHFTLRCCWRPWGEASLKDGVLTVTHPPMRLTICNGDGAPSLLATMKMVDKMPISRWSQQVSLPLKPGEAYRFVNLIHAEPIGKERPMAVRQLEDGDIEVVCDGRREVVKLDKSPAVLVKRRTEPSALTKNLLSEAWSYEGLDPAPQTLRVISATSSEPPLERYSPLEKLFDGEYSVSTVSVKWADGVRPTITAELAEENSISSVLLREWHMNPGWDIGERKLEVSSDGFKQDVRPVAGPFKNIGAETFGGNVNTLMEAKVGEKARQLRLTLAPARPNCSVYLAEMEVYGIRPGVRPKITACASGDLNGDGRPELIISGGVGQIQAVTSEGKVLWKYQSFDRAAIHALACADVDGDGRAEVMYGGAGERLGLLSADGQPLWQATPPKFRGIPSHVMTIFPADVNGDGRPEIVCGCASWQYFAYDAQGNMLWKHIIYAHSATVGCAADLDKDGKEEIIAGNTYYRLNVIDHDGQQLWRTANIGPEMTAALGADIVGDDRPEVLTGVDGGDLHCYDPAGKELWRTNLGDKVTRILAVDLNGDGKHEIICSAESANVFALNGQGKILWRTPLPDGVSDIAVVRRSPSLLLAAAAGEAGVVLLDAAGHVQAQAPTEGRADFVTAAQNGLIVVNCKGQVKGFSLP